MGFLRLLLALSIISYHAKEPHGPIFLSFAGAITSFFIISGFYMALILDGKYKSKLSFYINRGLRIMPLYWVATALTVLVSILKTFFGLGSDNVITHYFAYSQPLTGALSFVELINFIIRNLTLIITTDYFQIKNLVAGFLIVNQAWTLQIELIFYLLVPFIILIRKNFINFILLYAVIFYGIINPLHTIYHDSLIYRFMDQFIFFLLGMASYRYIYLSIKDLKMGKYIWTIYILLMLYFIFYFLVPFKLTDIVAPYSLIYYTPLAVFIAFIFNLFKNNRVDRYIGELSYPVYIFHMIFARIFFTLHLPNIQFLNTFLISITTIIFSIFLIKLIQDPIDKIRLKIKK